MEPPVDERLLIHDESQVGSATVMAPNATG